MKKIFIVITLILSLVLFSCNKGKIAEHEKTIENLNSQIALLQEENDNLKNTDQYYYQSGADEFLNGNYWEALVWMGKLKVKFPTSLLLVYANKIIEDSKSKIDKIILTSKNTAFKDFDKSGRPVTYYYIPGVGDIPQKPINYGDWDMTIVDGEGW